MNLIVKLFTDSSGKESYCGLLYTARGLLQIGNFSGTERDSIQISVRESTETFLRQSDKFFQEGYLRWIIHTIEFSSK